MAAWPPGAKDTLEMVLGDVSNVHVVSLARDDKEPITIRWMP